MIKDDLFAYIDSISDRLTAMSDAIFDRPETAFEETFAAGLLTDFLAERGFDVQLGLGSLGTAFRASFEIGEGGPVIGLLCEYDALVGMGHGCAHQMQGPAILGAADALRACAERAGGPASRIVVYGTPGEEGGGGKVTMLREGFLRDIDVALMMHGGPATQTDVKSMALQSFEVEFHGRSTHAALKPEEGRSALDALLLAIQGLEFMREHVRDDTRMHYTIKDAGGPANVVPARAVGSFVLRSYSSVYLDELCVRFADIAKGAALMTGTTGEVRSVQRLESKVPVPLLNEILMRNADLVDAPNRKPAREKTGSTDFGNVMYVLPGAVIRLAFVPDGTSSHSQEFLDAGKSEAGHAAVIYAAKILAGASFDLIENPGLVNEAKREFDEAKKKL